MVCRIPSRLAVAALSISLIACGGGAPVSPTPINPVVPIPSTVTVPTLTWPINGGYVQQNDSTIGCRYDPVFGYGFKVPFEWTPVSGVTQYDIELKSDYASIPLLTKRVSGTSYDYLACNIVVGDDGWKWKVRPVHSNGTTVGEWTAPFILNFMPCRLSTGLMCAERPT